MRYFFRMNRNCCEQILFPRFVAAWFTSKGKADGFCVFMKHILNVFLLILWTIPTMAFALPQADLVLVKKSEARLYLLKSGKVFRKYPVVFGAHPKGHKLQKGDERTPEGRYFLDYKNAHSRFYKSIHISYPNKSDRERARKAHVNPGGAIMIHGQKNGWGWASFIAQHFNWTDGCIAVSNKDMDEIWDAVKGGTPIEIKP
jgi:murein L,D-transpeptidase YafK